MDRFYNREDISAAYFKYRPRYSDEVTEVILKYVRSQNKNAKFDVLLDVGCGSGQSTNLFASHFKNIIGVDASENQIKFANEQNKHKHIKYMVGRAEDLPVPSDSVDLITCGASVHWLDLTRFLEEAQRIMKPTGHLAMFCYWFSGINPVGMKNEAKSSVTADILVDLFRLGTDIQPVILKEIKEQYTGLFELLPFTNKERLNNVCASFKWSLADICGLVNSSACKETLENQKDEVEKMFKDVKHTKEGELDMLTAVSEMVKKIWCISERKEEEIELDVHLDIFIVVAANNK